MVTEVSVVSMMSPDTVTVLVVEATLALICGSCGASTIYYTTQIDDNVFVLYMYMYMYVLLSFHSMSM